MDIATIFPPANCKRCAFGGEAVELIDVRTPVEFREVHADLARNVPLDSLDPAASCTARPGRQTAVCHLP